VAKLGFDNKNKIEISSTKLIWRPFYKIFFELNTVQADPIKRKHRITDSGFFIFDALITSPQKQEDMVSNVVKSISFGLLGKSVEEKKEEKDFSKTQPDNYKIIKLSPQIAEVVARGKTIDYVV
jgi:hypothetical protein